MPPSPAMRCSPGRETRAEIHKRGRSLEGGILFREKDEDLALFNEVQSKEKDSFLLQQSNDDFEDLFSSKLRYFSDNKIGINIPARGGSSNDLLLNAEGDKNDYDWLLTPPETPLFPSLDDEMPSSSSAAQRGRARSQPISISRSSTMERSQRSSRGSASPNRLSPSPRSGQTTYQTRGRPSSSGMHSSPPSVARPATPTRRPSPTPAPRSSTPTHRRIGSGSSGPGVPSRVRGNSPIKVNRGSSPSPKIKAWQTNIPGFPSEAPPNLRTSLGDRPASYVRGSSPASSRNGSKSGRQSMSPTASRSVCSSYSHDRDRFSSHSKGSVASSGDDDVDSLQSLPISSSDHSAPRSTSTFSNGRGLSSPKKPTKVVASSSAPKRSFDIAIRQMDHRKSPQNMFRPLLSSVPSSTFHAGKTSAAHRSIVSRNSSSVTTSSNASSDFGTSGAHDTEGSEQNQEDISSAFVKAVDHFVHEEEVFAFDKGDSTHSEPQNNGDLPECHDEIDHHPTLKSEVMDDEKSGQNDAAMVTSVASGADNLEDMVICDRCGCGYRVNNEIEEDLKLCRECRDAEICYVLTSLSETVMAGEQSLGDLVDDSACVVKPEVFAACVVGDSESGPHSEVRHNLPEASDAPGEPMFASQQHSENQTTVSNIKLDGEVSGQDLPKTSSVLNSKVDISEGGSGISVLLTSNSGKGPIVRTRTFTATSITCDDFSYLRDSATSTRSSCGHGTTSASSSADWGSGRQIEARYHRQVSSKKSDTESYRSEMYTKHGRSASSLSGASTQGFQASSFATSSHEGLQVSAIHDDDKYNLAPAHVDPSLASESVELDHLSIDIESDSKWRTVSELSNDTVIIQMVDATTSVSNMDEALPEYCREDLADDSCSGINFEVVASSLSETSNLEDESTPNAASTDRMDDSAEAPNLATPLDAISELDFENDHAVSPDSVFDIASQNSRSSMDDDLRPESSHPPESSSNDVGNLVEGSINQDYSHSIREESSVVLEDHAGIHSRSLTLEEATDTILFCSSIVHSLAYEAANIASEKENKIVHTEEGAKLMVTLVGKSNPERRDPRARVKRNAKSHKARQRRLEIDSKPPPDSTNAPMDEKENDNTSTRMVGVSNKGGDSMKPPKLESKCNCTIM
ncbi:OLC1v1028723C1 [Oldenlandia corymbosa var. corymbosa]|uniref:OLC1v1028723C1 n=1 Tax=Oldenlandia corymbosa var. corymbosa TaxID=529605 RepID=A0AAV1CCU7_OLDCO|nr:OLC1v1028723C1 [Oldenlandia corymbosa var. corymbosa]